MTAEGAAPRKHRPVNRSTSRPLQIAWVVLAMVVGACVTISVRPTPVAEALDNTPWVLPSSPPRCTVQQVDSGNVAGCTVTFYDDPAATGWGSSPRPRRRARVGPGTATGTTGRRRSPTGKRPTSPPTPSRSAASGRARCRRTSRSRALFEGFLDEITANGYRVRDASGYAFRCTSGNGGWNCPSGDPTDLSNHAWGLAIDMNASTNPIRSYSSVNGVTACMTPIQTDLPQWVIQTAEKWGLYWGGYGWNAGCPSTSTQRTVVSRDPPHFEFRGTPQQAAAIAGFNLRNNPTSSVATIVNDAGAEVEQCSLSRLPGAGARLPVHLDPPDGAVAAMINLTATEGTSRRLPDARGLRRALRARARHRRSPTPPGSRWRRWRSCRSRRTGRSACIDRRRCTASSTSPPISATRVSGCGSSRRHRPDSPTPASTASANRDSRAARAAARARHATLVPTADDDARIVNLTVVDSRSPGWLQVGRCADVGPAGSVLEPQRRRRRCPRQHGVRPARRLGHVRLRAERVAA